MSSSSAKGGQNSPQVLSRESMLLLEEGVSIVFSQWTALQMAIAEEGYSCSCDRKYQDLISSILSWFNQSKESLYIDDLENLLDDSLVHSFGVVTEDGSIEEVAEQLMIFHEDLLQGNHASIEKLRKAGSTTDVLSRSKQITLDNSNWSSEDESSDMMVDEPTQNATAITDTTQAAHAPDEDGWCIVPSRRRRGAAVTGRGRHGQNPTMRTSQ